MKAHGIGPAVWQNIFTYPKYAPYARKDLQPWMGASKRYYNAIDAVTRGERRICGCGEGCSVDALRRTRPFP